MAGTEEDKGKGRAPKGLISLRRAAWACNEELYDCHLGLDGALSKMNNTEESLFDIV